MKRLAAGALVLGGLALGVDPSRADLVLLATGELLKVESHRVVDGKLEVELPFGGRMTLDLSVVDRVLDDEVVAETDGVVGALDDVEIGFQADQPVPPTPYGDTMHALGKRFGLNPRLIAAVVKAESAFDPEALSHQGAQGLMQIMPATADRFGVSSWSIFEPEVNLEVGVRYLAELRARYAGDLVLMLAAYNAGEATVERFGGVPPYVETREYIRRIERFYRESGR